MALTLDGTEGIGFPLGGVLKDATASLTANGYAKLPNGLIIQWGSIPTAGPQTVSFPIPFPNAVFSVAVSVNGTSGSSFTWAQARITNTLTQISTSSGGDAVRYIAIGY